MPLIIAHHLVVQTVPQARVLFLYWATGQLFSIGFYPYANWHTGCSEAEMLAESELQLVGTEIVSAELLCFLRVADQQTN